MVNLSKRKKNRPFADAYLELWRQKLKRREKDVKYENLVLEDEY
jgi:hypothetical protein